jgi:cytochrome c biogenesis protein CcmG/thiol:disulfide interchange protein DsbE
MDKSEAPASDHQAGHVRSARRWIYVIPVVAFVVLAFALALGLQRDPSLLPSALVGGPAPEIALPAVPGHGPEFTNADFIGKVSLVNVFASWCVSCRYEHPLLMEVANSGDVAVYGLAYKDAPEDTAAWLDQLGNPYAGTAADVSGRAGIDWGVYGVPETFLIAPDGTVAFKHVGPITAESWRDTLAPRITELLR